MPIFEVQLPDGRIVEVADAPNVEAANEFVTRFLREERRNAPRTGSSLARGVDELQGSLYSAAEGVGRATGFQGLEAFGREGRIRNQQEAEQSLPQAQRQSFEEAETLGDYARAAGQALGSTAAPTAAGLAGALAGGAVGGPIGAIVGGGLAAFPQFFGQNRQRQMEANPEQPVSEGIAALTAVPQAALEGVADRITLGLAGIFGRSAQEVGRTVIPRIVRGLGIGAATEIPTEIGQAILERAQAGLPVDNDEAFREYREAGIAAGVVGGTVGGTISGVAGPRPAAPVPPPAQQQQQQQDSPPEPEDSALPPIPAPIETPDQARAFFATNREYAPRFEVTDDEAIMLANRMQERAYAAEVTSLRNDAISRFMGVPAVRTLTERSEDGKETTREVRDTQADQFQQAIVQAAADPNQFFDVANFSPVDVANVALRRFGTETPTSQELGFVRKQLNALMRAGFLERGEEKGTFAIAPRNLDALRQRAAEQQRRTATPTRADRIPSEVEATERQLAFPNLTAAATDAPPTTQQQAAANVLATIGGGQFAQLSAADRTRLIERVLQDDATVGSAFSEYEQNLQQTDAMARIRAQNPAVAATPEFQQLETTLASQRANIIDRLTGLQNLSAIAPAAEQPTLTDAPTRGPGSFPGDLSNNPEALLTAMAQANETQRSALFEQLMGDDATAVAAFQRVTQDLPARAGMTWNRWQQLFRANNIPFTEQQGRLAYDRARQLGIINPLGQLTWRPQDTAAPRTSRAQPAAEPDIQPDTNTQETAVEPEVQPATEPDISPEEAAARDHTGPAFDEPSREESDALLGDERSGDVAFARGAKRTLPGLRINSDGSFDYIFKIDNAQHQGSVTISGEIMDADNAVFVSGAYGSEHLRGRGYGIQAYQNLVDWAHTNGYDFWSDAAVSTSAARVYRSLENRGYDVRQSPQAYRDNEGWVTYTPETRGQAEPVFKIPRSRAAFAQP